MVVNRCSLVTLLLICKEVSLSLWHGEYRLIEATALSRYILDSPLFERASLSHLNQL